MAYDQHSSYSAPQRGYQQQYGSRQQSQQAQGYGTYDPYAEDAGNPFGDNGYAQQDNGYAHGYGSQGYAHQDNHNYATQGREQSQEYARPQQEQRRPIPAQVNGGGYDQQDRYMAQPDYGRQRYAPQNGQGYEQRSNGNGYKHQNGQGYEQRSDGRGYDQGNSGHRQYQQSQGHGQQGHDQQQQTRRSPQASYDQRHDTRQQDPGQQRYHDQQSAYRSDQRTQQSYAPQGRDAVPSRNDQYARQDERRYDPRYQQRSGRGEQPHAMTTPPTDPYGYHAQGQRQGAVRSPPNGSLQSSQSAPILQNAGPKKLSMEEWKVQEKARMHSDANKPKTVAQDNAFPTFPTKKASSNRGESAMSNRSGEERPATASSVRNSDRPSCSRNGHSQSDLNDSARPSFDQKFSQDSRPSLESHRRGSPQHYGEMQPPPVIGRPARKDSYGSSARPLVSPLDTSVTPTSAGQHIVSPLDSMQPQRTSGDARPQTADSRFARKPVEQPMSPLGKYAQNAPGTPKPGQALTREEEIEAEMPDFDSAAPGQSAARSRRLTIDQHLTPVTHDAPPVPNFDFGFSPSAQGLERPVQPYANETQERRSLDDGRQGTRSLVHGRPPPQRFYPEAAPPRPDYDRQGTTYSDPGVQRAGSVPPQNPDALPAHPAPVRAGLMGGGALPASRPPPVRNYQGNNSQPPPQPSSRVPSGAEATKQPITQAEIQQLRAQVEANPQSLSLSLTYAKKLVEAAKVLSTDGGRADAKTAAKNRERYLMEAYKRVKKLSSSGYPDGQFYLADCYGQGLLGLEVDPREAFKLYQAAAKAGHATAAYRTAVCCEIGSDEGGGTSRDYPRAVQWYKRAAALGETAAMFKVGMIALKGLLGQPRHLGEAVIWLKRAAERADKDNPHALYELGVLYETANSTPDVRQKIIPDDAYALSLYNKAAELGSKNAQFRLGQSFEYGQLGLPVDHRSSIAWYSKSAAQGNHEAELALSGWYLTGAPGILQQSDVEAYLWARKAAQSEPPLAKSLFALGYYNEAGIGCPVNIDEAKRWYSRAASYKHPKALERLDAIKRGAKGGYKAMPTNARGKLNRKDQHQDENECSVM